MIADDLIVVGKWRTFIKWSETVDWDKQQKQLIKYGGC